MRTTAVAAIVTVVASLGAAACAPSRPAASGQAQASSAPAQASSSPAPSSAASAPSCSTAWGTASRIKAAMVQTAVRDVRTGKHACYDRLVIDLGPGAAPGYNVRYVNAFYDGASGTRVPVSGPAKLLVTVTASAADSFASNDRQLAGFAEFRQVTGLGSFEGVTSIGIGLRARTAFRVLELQGSDHKVKLVIDVAVR